ncbi:MAG: CRISPR-associated protein Cas4 [Desulfurococcaceae archaeon]|jgi:CRISPR-associated exonuclease Cas4|nr:CRISPR-associated protein Cas4 [Desulfurococcaceae archaeon]
MNMISIVDKLYRWRIDEAVKKLESKLDNEFYVTDLIYCPLKYRYQKMYKELTISSAINPTTLLGELTHYGVEKILIDLFGPENVKLEVDYEKGIEVDGVLYIVKGRIDAIIGDWVIEVKTSRSDISIPQNHHVMQTRIYLWLTGFNKALLLYITSNRVAEYIVDKPASDGEIADLLRSTITGAPAPRYPWECRYCTYSTLCPYKKSVES